MLYGQDDELIDPGRCDQVADDLRFGGSAVRVISYPGAVHQWDGEMSRGSSSVTSPTEASPSIATAR